MALYEYKCKDCGHISEILTGSEQAKCDKCGSEKMEKILSSFAVSMKQTSSAPHSCPGGGCCGGACGLG